MMVKTKIKTIGEKSNGPADGKILRRGVSKGDSNSSNKDNAG